MMEQSNRPSEMRDSGHLNFEESYAFFHSWTPESDVFAMKNFQYASAGSTVISAVYINSFFRRFLKMKTFGLISSYSSAVLIPAYLGSFSHYMLVHKPLLLRRYKCSVCIETRSGALQGFFAVCYPILMASIMNFMVSSRYKTIAVPNVYQDKIGIFQLIKKICRPHKNALLFLGIVNFFGGMFWCQMEMNNYLQVLSRLAKMDEELAQSKEIKTV